MPILLHPVLTAAAAAQVAPRPIHKSLLSIILFGAPPDATGEAKHSALLHALALDFHAHRIHWTPIRQKRNGTVVH